MQMSSLSRRSRFFLPRLLLIARLWDRKMADPSLSPSSLLFWLETKRFLKLYTSAPIEGLVWVVLKSQKLCVFLRMMTFCSTLFLCKTLRDGASNVFGIRRHSNPQLCPAKAIETYVAVASELRITLSNGYLFRNTNHLGHILNKPLTSSSAEARLKFI